MASTVDPKEAIQEKPSLKEKPSKSTSKTVKKQYLTANALGWHIAGLTVVGLLLLWLTWINFGPMFRGSASATEQKKIDFPPVDWKYIAEQPVVHKARVKPFQTAANEVMLSITGRFKWQKLNAVQIVLDWMFEKDPKQPTYAPDDQSKKLPLSKWNDREFIICENKTFRRYVFAMNEKGEFDEVNAKTEAVIEHGKYVSPNQVQNFLDRLIQLRKKNAVRFRELRSQKGDFMSPLSELSRRYGLYRRIRFVPKFVTPNEATTNTLTHPEESVRDPFAFVMLDRVPMSPWFTINQLRLVAKNPANWEILIKDRFNQVPELYLTPDHKDALVEFQTAILDGRGKEAIDELRPLLKKNREQLVKEYVSLRSSDDTTNSKYKASKLVARSVFTWRLNSAERKSSEEFEKFVIELCTPHGLQGEFADTFEKRLQGFVKSNTTVDMLTNLLMAARTPPEQVAAAFTSFLEARDKQSIKGLQALLPAEDGNYIPIKAEYQPLHMRYLETRFPYVYREALQSQPPQVGGAKLVLHALDQAGEAYRKGEIEKFDEEIRAVFQTMEIVSEDATGQAYPGEDSVSSRLEDLFTGDEIQQPNRSLLQMEMTFNKLRPFMWSWVLMLGALLAFCLSLGLNSRIAYIAGFVVYIASLLFQTYGFFIRIVLSGRAPVSNMYETVIWVAFMSGVFALVMEWIYRRKVIALAGALVSTIGLVLADQMPVALNPAINPLLPVLRSNFWLTIHVLTIVSSYAGGTLAWGLGNITMALIVFGSTNRDTIKMLTNFTYRALQIAVILLAVGTFLGGWWAAYSWGRFWGWDAKENGALIALLCYVIPLHMRYIGWIREFGLAVAAILCYVSILISWYGVNFIFPAGLHAYGSGSGGATWVYWACMLNVLWVLIASWMYRYKLDHGNLKPVVD
ncbi:MAG: cytochrome c biogenesis protein [Gemmataceae bacterium]